MAVKMCDKRGEEMCENDKHGSTHYYINCQIGSFCTSFVASQTPVERKPS